MGWVLGEDRGLLLAQARDARGWRRSTRPNIDAFGLVIGPASSTRRPSRSTGSSSATAAPRCKRAGAAGAARAARHRRLPRRASTRGCKAEGGTRAVDARGHLRRQRDHRPDLRPGRRRRGAALGVPLDAAQALRRDEGRSGCFDDLSEFDDPDAPTTMSKTFPYGKAIGIGKGNAVLDAGSFKPIGPKRPRRAPRARTRAGRATSCWSARSARRPATRCSSAARRSATRTPASRSRPTSAGPGVAGARRDRAGLRGQHPDRPRPGLRVEPDLGRART